MKKSLEISAKFDTSDFDKSVDRMAARLKDLYAPSDTVRQQTQSAARLSQMGYSGFKPPSDATQQRSAMEYQRNLDTYIQKNYQKEERLTKVITQREETLKKMTEKQSKLTKDSDEELKIKEKILRVEQNLAMQRDRAGKIHTNLNNAADIKQAYLNKSSSDYGNMGDDFFFFHG